MRIFLAAPFTQHLGPDGAFCPRRRAELTELRTRLQAHGAVFLAHEREAWGRALMPPEDCVPLDYSEMLAADVVVSYPGDPPSPGVCVETGWASALGKPVILYCPGRRPASPMLTGLKYVSEVHEAAELGEMDSILERLALAPVSGKDARRRMAPLVGAIKLGSTTVALRVGRLGEGGRPEIALKRKDTICLGAGLAKSGALRMTDMETVLAYLAGYRGELEKLGAAGVVCAAGFALRRARNAGEFLGLVSDRLGLAVRTLGGDEEGRVTYDGVASEVGGPMLLVDVGGGSTEFVGPERSLSVNLGALTLTKSRAWPDPPAPAIEAMRRWAKRRLRGKVGPDLTAGASRVLAVDGTANQLWKLVLAAAAARTVPEAGPSVDRDSSETALWTIGVDELGSWLDTLAALPLDERARLPGMVPGRAGVIVGGLAIHAEILALLGASRLEVSTRDTSFGLWLLAARGYRGPGWTALPIRGAGGQS